MRVFTRLLIVLGVTALVAGAFATRGAAQMRGMSVRGMTPGAGAMPFRSTPNMGFAPSVQGGFGNMFGASPFSNRVTNSGSFGGMMGGYGSGGSGSGGSGSGGSGGYGSNSSGTDDSDDSSYQSGYDNSGYGSSGNFQRSEMKTASSSGANSDQLPWPIGLKILAGHGCDELRDRIDGLFVVAARQQRNGENITDTVQEINRSVSRLRGLLQQDEDDRFAMPRAVYAEAKRFLSSLEKAPLLMQAKSGDTGGATQGNK